MVEYVVTGKVNLTVSWAGSIKQDGAQYQANLNQLIRHKFTIMTCYISAGLVAGLEPVYCYTIKTSVYMFNLLLLKPLEPL